MATVEVFVELPIGKVEVVTHPAERRAAIKGWMLIPTRPGKLLRTRFSRIMDSVSICLPTSV